MVNALITRKEAKALGFTRYCTGKLCQRGHICERRTSDGGCVECRRKQMAEWRKITGFANRRNKRKRDANPSKHRARLKKWCLGCNVSFGVIQYTVDHVIPLSRDGSNWPSNLQLLCGPCNCSKHTKLMGEWKKAA